MTRRTTLRPLLSPLVPLYRIALALRERKYQPGSKSIRQLSWPVVSVGNLSTGGSGKTPLTIALAKALAVRGVQVDVLSRGYGRRSALPLLVDLRGTADEFGDEPLLIARETGVPVVVAAERHEAGRLVERSFAKASEQIGELASEALCVHLLDDGFQHRQLHRDVDILILSQRDIEDRLLPAGNLREALRAAGRAHVIAIPEDEPEVAAEIERRGWHAAIWRIRRCMEIPPPDGPVAAFCGIARPEQFFAGLERGGVAIAARFAFPDHHRYSAADLSRIAAVAEQTHAAALLTTEKDRVRLGALASGFPSSLPLESVPLRIEIENEAAALAWLFERLQAGERADDN